MFDPGIGFGKNPLQSLRLLRGIGRFSATACAASSAIRANRSCIRLAAERTERDLFTIGVSLNLSAQSVEILRVHDVAGTSPRIAAGRTRADYMRRREPGDVVALRYITTDARIEMCWPCRVVEDSNELLALFIAAGSPYKAGPKRTAQAKRTAPRLDTPPDDYVWRNDTLRLMLPGERHSVSLSWSRDAGHRRLLKYFVNLEEPYRQDGGGIRHARSHVGRRSIARARVALA